MEKHPANLTPKDYSISALRAILKGIPYIGATLEQFVFGPLTELRMRRIQTTLDEIASSLELRKQPYAVNTEEFVNLLESVAPKLSRAVNDDRRQRFRDLLLNAATVPPGSAGWEEAALASRLLEEIEAPGLAIIAAIGRCREASSLTLTSRPVPQVYEGDFDYENPGGPQHAIPHEWVVIEEWARRLREKRLISFQSHDARGGFGGVRLTQLGEFLIRWTLIEDDSTP